MFANFRSSFRKDRQQVTIPKEIIAFLSGQLPENFEYTRTNHEGALVLQPKDVDNTPISISFYYLMSSNKLKC
ncbi:hypothetical protein EC604_23180 [Paenibacillus amylolyticus]|uniref:Uncharacterized protein n=1 Tax=Paenibacillus amylolyticus TaxID=1451 RepID=A0A5M9WYS4_PAEAM|nr:hypothetical protein EC604_23180 [Paenibacillus amylolyticus]